MASIMACVVIASPDSASTLAAASRALVFLGLGSFAAFLALVWAGAAASGAAASGAAASGAADSGAADSGATSTDLVTSAGVDAGAGGSAVGCSGRGGAAASGGVSIATGDSGGTGGSVAAGTWTSGASAGLRPFLCLAALPCGLGDCFLAMVGSPRCG